MNFQPIARVEGQDIWHNDHFQFARLVAKLSEFGVFTPNVRQALSAAFEEEPEKIDELVHRAELAFDDSLTRYLTDAQGKEVDSAETTPAVIPTTLEEVFTAFAAGNSEQTIADVKSMDEEEFVGRAHPDMGRGIRNAWFLWWTPALAAEAASKNVPYPYPTEEPALVKWLREEFGLTHGDDRSGILLRSWHRFLNNKRLDMNDQAIVYREHWLQQENQA